MKYVMQLLLTILFCLPAYSYAQEHKTYYTDEQKITTNIDSAKTIKTWRVASDGTYEFELRKITGNVLMANGHFLTPDSISLTGSFSTYSDSGLLFGEGQFVNNKKEGPWKYYYPDGKTVWFTENMRADKNDGELRSYYADGKLKRVEQYKDGNTVSGKRYNEEGKEISFTPFSVMPAPAYDMMQYLNSNLHYPAKAKRKGIEGRVRVQFVVMKDGSIDDVKITKGIGGGCDEEAMRVIKDMAAWKPARQDDRPVKVMYTQPLSFKLE